ncbi:hypothetical protein CHISP_1207 [Chitinispirillum alkaliphilum]|nr:hypothetical protein CHISP_1207 [Chitinispirillum alkaliphilum]
MNTTDRFLKLGILLFVFSGLFFFASAIVFISNISKTNIENTTDYSILTVPLLLCALLLGMIGYVFYTRSKKQQITLTDIIHKYTKEIVAEITDVRKITTITYTEGSPYRIEAQWYDEKENCIYTFQSQNIWIDPKKYISDTITVRVHPRNHKKYWVDISSIPK